MTSISTEVTAAALSPEPWLWDGTSVYSEEERQQDTIWKPKVKTRNLVVAVTEPLGILMLGGLTLFTIIAFMLFVFALFHPMVFVSPKFALFLTLFFGGFSGELVLARKLSRR